MEETFPLTWRVPLQSRCELQLKDQGQGREWGLTVPKSRQRLWNRLRYYTYSAFYSSCSGIKPTFYEYRFLDERRWPYLVMARSQHTLQHNFIIQGHQKNSKSNAYRIAQNRHFLLMLLVWSPSSPCNLLLLIQYRCLMTRPQNQRKDIQPQDQLIVLLGLQYAALAKSVKGLYAETCDGVRGMMPVFGGAALTIEANKEMRIKPPASIAFLYF